MNESILTSVKKILGINADDDSFDPDVVMAINTVFMTLYQMGVGPTDHAFSINDDSAMWSDFTDITDLEAVKTLVSLRTKMIFDPPTSSIHAESLNNVIKEMEWRLYIVPNYGLGGD